MARYRRIARSELPADTVKLARYLIGKTVVHDSSAGRASGRIVETEAYVVGDEAAHSYRGLTHRNRSLFLERGHAYVYFVYGMWFSLNVSGEAEGVGAGVLIRALEPIEGIPLMEDRRPRASLHRLMSGPGCVATTMEIGLVHDGLDLCGKGPLWLAAPVKPERIFTIGQSTRIGLTKETHRPLRFYERGNPSVSGPKRLSS
jgi:DNA-3-methyladenine glycosylase